MEPSTSTLDLRPVVAINRIVPRPTPADLLLITCLLCKGLVIRPLQCSACGSLQCKAHKVSRCSRCGKESFSQDVAEDVKSRLLSVRVRCFFRAQTFRYSELLRNWDRCKADSKFKVFSGTKGDLSEEDNLSINVNLAHENYAFSLGTYQYDLLNFSREVYSRQVNNYIFQQLFCRQVDDHVPQPVWTVNLQTNNYTLYSVPHQQNLEKGYQRFLRNPEAMDVSLNFRGENYRVILAGDMIQINENTQGSRQVARTLV